MLKLFRPFHKSKGSTEIAIRLGWLFFLIAFWVGFSFTDTHIFPTPLQVGNGFSTLWAEGLVVHIGSSLGLCLRAVVWSVFISLSFCYLSPLPIINPIATVLSKFRYLPLAGIAFYLSILINVSVRFVNANKLL